MKLKTYMTRILTVALLMMFSMGAAADVKIFYGEKGEELKTGETKIKADNGTIAIEQKASGDGSQTAIYLTFTPETGYTISTDNIEVYAVISPSSSPTRTPEISGDPLQLNEESSKDPDKRYSVKIDSNLGLWIKKAEFVSESKGGGNRSVTDYPETYFIRSESANKNTPGDYYLCPTKKWYLYKDKDSYENDTDDDDDNGNPFLTTYQCKDGVYDVSKAVWAIVKHPTEENCYYIIQAKTGRYLVSNGQIGTDANRMRVHLESVADDDALSTLGDLALFEITSHEQHVDIVPHSSAGRNGDSYKYLVVNFKNFNELKGSAGKGGGPGNSNTAGIIGLYNQEENHKWFLEETPVRPTITDNSDGTFTISAASGATIYYTTDGTTPTTSTPTTGITPVTVTQTGSITIIKAIAKGENDFSPSKVTTYDLPRCEKPVITVSGGIVTITCATEGASIRYTTNGDQATSSSTEYTAPFAKGDATTIKAIATKTGYANSIEAVLLPPKEVSSLDDITDMSGNYILTSNFSSSGSIGTSDNPFRGTIDGNLIPLALSYPLVAYAKDATIKNVILDNVSISGGTNVGAICNEASGDTRIYNCGVLASNSTANTDEDGYTYLTNCSSTISGTNYVGSIVGLLDGNSRVINCFSFANVSGGSEVGGIVGHNNVATTASNLKTMVMNCMFYGEVSGTSIAPIYNGEIITNVDDNKGVSNFNYFRLEASYIQNTDITKVYNCALGAETRFLQRFEFFRHLLNSNRELAAWWATGNAANKDEMMKWVMEPTQIGTSTPYPILKTPDKYASVVNYTPSTTAYNEDYRNEGRKLTSEGDGGVLHVTIRMGDGAVFNRPFKGTDNAATITTSSVDLTITDKDFEHFNYNYGKVQLPYYNDYGTQNYKDNRVVTGWKIVDITGGTAGSYSTGQDVTYDANGNLTATPYNFADRKCTNKDLNTQSGRVFNQGAYWDVPEGVSAITIEPYWGKAVYLADAYYDVVYNSGMTTAYPVTTVGGGQHYNNGVSTFNGQLVYTSMSNAISSSALFSGGDANNHAVYDYAVVLVGNYHQYGSIEASNSKPYTVTSVDLDGDNEPDYSFMLRFDGRTGFHPVRYDFLNLIGLGMAQKSTGGTGSYNLGIMQPKSWFEVTNTALFRVTQFEYSPSGRSKKPIILQGGVIEQWVTQQNDAGDRVEYFHVGGNVWFKEFHRGSHQDNPNKYTPHPPVSVTGGDYNKFYLTGLYQSQATIYDDNAECYINGGRFGEMAGAGMEGIGTSDGKGNITWVIDNADIKEFYGGGINFAKPAHGNIHTIISNSHVNQFCGGPKFGDMESGRTVITTATDCTFGTYFGAGFGGNSYNRYAPANRNNVINLPGQGKVNNVAQNLNSWNEWVAAEYTQSYNSTYGGVSTQIDYQFIPMSTNTDNVARLWVEFVNFSLATCHNVNSTLSGCTITGNFYGGGSLGKVEGNVTSTLTNCEVTGSVYGAGFSASLPTVEVMNTGGFLTVPYYYTDLGTYRKGVFPQTTPYTWQSGDEISIDPDKPILYTDADLSSLGKVTGDVKLTIEGHTTLTDGKVMSVGGSVYGGGEESNVSGNTEVIMSGGTVTHNVFGGGKGMADNYECDKAMVGIKGQGVIDGVLQSGGTKVTIGNGTVIGDVYGGGELGRVEKNTEVVIGLAEGTSNPVINGSVYGAGAGVETHGYSALVRGNSSVTVQGEANVGKSVYGGGKTASVGRFKVVGGLPTEPQSGGTCTVTIQGKAKVGSGGSGDVFGTCQGVEPTYSYTASSSYDDRMNNSKSMQTFENKPDGDEGKTWDYYKDEDGNIVESYVWEYFPEDDDYYAFLKTLALASNADVTIGGSATVKNGSVYGGGQRGITLGKVDVKMTGGTVEKDIYGGGALADTNKGNWNGNVYEEVSVEVGESVTGLYKRTGEGTAEKPYKYTEYIGKKTAVGGNKYYRQIPTWATDDKSAKYPTNVTLKGGTVECNVYGGGLGRMEVEAKAAVNPVGEEGQEGYIPGIPAVEYEAGIAAKVYGDVMVKLNENNGDDENADNCKVKGSIFGCNNLNGTPMGDVTVHIYKTVGYDGTHKKSESKDGSSFDLAAVYGGGNLAAYVPFGDKNTANSTNVIIDGCGKTSIQYVYGGGNAASTPATNVTVNGTYEIEELFGGGNGKDDLPNGDPNPGANVGFYAYADNADNAQTPADRATNYGYGSGQASVNVFGGTIHRVFGGSNTKGNVRQTAVTLLDENSGCDFCVDEAYGGGKSAPMDAEAKLLMACIPGLSAAYGGAEAAAIQGNVTLNITNGTFDRVFGGNNLSGTINGSITVNIEEIGCKPIIIGELYGGGNQAGYSVYGYDNNDKPIESGVTPLYNDPQVNVKSFTSIGNIYGGGYGDGATMVGNPTVNINEVVGTPTNYPTTGDFDANGYKGKEKTIDGHTVILPSHINGKIGAINNVFGGGNAAEVKGNTTVNIGTLSEVYLVKKVTVGESVADYYTRNNDGTYTTATGTASESTTYYEKKTVIGADIRGNVYGGGNEAEVTGNTNVNIGRKVNTSTPTTP